MRLNVIFMWYIDVYSVQPCLWPLTSQGHRLACSGNTMMCFLFVKFQICLCPPREGWRTDVLCKSKGTICNEHEELTSQTNYFISILTHWYYHLQIYLGASHIFSRKKSRHFLSAHIGYCTSAYVVRCSKQSDHCIPDVDKIALPSFVIGPSRMTDGAI